MYHIPNDKRAKKSAESLYEGLLKSIEYKKFEEITVMDLCSISDVSRATFYRLFDNIADIMQWKCESIMSEVMESIRVAENKTVMGIMEKSIQIWIKNHRFVEALIRCDRVSMLYDIHTKNIEGFQEIFFTEQNMSEEETAYLPVLLGALLPATLYVWMQYPTEDSGVVLNRIRQGIKLLDTIFISG